MTGLRGTWIVAGTSAEVDWQLAAAALAAVAGHRVAVLVVGSTGQPPAELLLERIATWQTVRDGGAGPLTAGEVGRLVLALRPSHGLVLVAAEAGLLVPLGRGGWTLADLALSLSASAVVVTGAGPDAVNHTTLALGALAGHGIAATVIAVGNQSGLDGLPVTPAGRLPADAADRPADFTAAAAEWLEPLLRSEPAPAAPPEREVPTVRGRRVVVALLAVFAVAVLLACGLALVNRPAPSSHTSLHVSVSMVAAKPAVPMPRSLAATNVCPQWTREVVPVRASKATQARVDAAWKRIEHWLAAHTSASRDALRPPATTASIDRLQRQMSVAFPADLVASLRRHDGEDSGGFTLPPFYRPMTTAQILGDWTATCQAMAGIPTLSSDWFDQAFIPYATAGDGGCLLADQRPGGHGRVGEFYPDSGTDFDRWPASITELLEGTARSLETGKPYAGRYRPEVDGGVLRWKIG